LIGVSDTSPLIALAKLNLLGLLPRLFGEIAIPEAVGAEVVRGWTDEEERRGIEDALVADWLTINPVPQEAIDRLNLAGLGRGESEAIALAYGIPDAVLIADDLSARKAAERVGLRVIGTAGILISAAESGLIAEVLPVLNELKNRGFRMSSELIETIAKRLED
jgi:predicted nucleic acid-binding protein